MKKPATSLRSFLFLPLILMVHVSFKFGSEFAHDHSSEMMETIDKSEAVRELGGASAGVNLYG